MRPVRFIRCLAIIIASVAIAVSAQAAANRTFVSTVGSDSNTALNCGATTPCRTFGAALSVTNSGGELVVLTSGGYGPATIIQPVIITAIGVDASISAASGNGITINTSGNVTLTGLNLHGEGTGNNGVEVQQVGFLRLSNMLIENFTNNGVDFEVPGKLEISGSTINDNRQNGVYVLNPSASAFVHNASFSGNGGFGMGTGSGVVTVVDSSSEFNGTGFGGGALTLVNDRVVSNNDGLSVGPGAAVYFANCLFVNNN